MHHIFNSSSPTYIHSQKRESQNMSPFTHLSPKKLPFPSPNPPLLHSIYSSRHISTTYFIPVPQHIKPFKHIDPTTCPHSPTSPPQKSCYFPLRIPLYYNLSTQISSLSPKNMAFEPAAPRTVAHIPSPSPLTICHLYTLRPVLINVSCSITVQNVIPFRFT